jgi:glycosyltransferase involved in cell wall biosynthesis
MRLVFANPHVHFYGKFVAKLLTGQKALPKYFYLLNYLMKDKHRSTAFFIDGTRSSFNEFGIRFRFLPKFFCYLELILWMLINGLNPLKHKVFFDVKKLNPKEDVILNFAFSTIDSFPRNNDKVQFHDYEGLVLTHLTHYFRDCIKINNYLKRIKHSFLIAESDLTHNDYFHHYFPEVSHVYQLPFTYGERFKNLTPFYQRENKCFGIGTFSTGKPKDFVSFFGEGANIQPMRKSIYQRKDELAAYIDCYMYDFDPVRSIAAIQPDDPLKIRLVKKYLPYFVLHKILPSYQSTYLKFDIVEKYNQYRMFVCPEEIVGLPSINVLEGMACGSVFFGIDHPMYTDLGMKDGVNYVAYKKDSIESLVEKIQFYQKHEEKLEKISRSGAEFVVQFRPQKMVDRLWADVEKLSESFRSGHPVFSCSFRN